MSALVLGALPLSASANCKLMTVSLPVTVIGLRPLLPAKRRGELDAAIRHYDDALRLNPKLGWSLYGRGLAERRKGDSGRADADIAAAVAINPKLPDQIRRRGIEDAAAKG